MRRKNIFWIISIIFIFFNFTFGLNQATLEKYKEQIKLKDSIRVAFAQGNYTEVLNLCETYRSKFPKDPTVEMYRQQSLEKLKNTKKVSSASQEQKVTFKSQKQKKSPSSKSYNTKNLQPSLSHTPTQSSPSGQVLPLNKYKPDYVKIHSSSEKYWYYIVAVIIIFLIPIVYITFKRKKEKSLKINENEEALLEEPTGFENLSEEKISKIKTEKEIKLETTNSSKKEEVKEEEKEKEGEEKEIEKKEENISAKEDNIEDKEKTEDLKTIKDDTIDFSKLGATAEEEEEETLFTFQKDEKITFEEETEKDELSIDNSFQELDVSFSEDNLGTQEDLSSETLSLEENPPSLDITEDLKLEETSESLSTDSQESKITEEKEIENTPEKAEEKSVSKNELLKNYYLKNLKESLKNKNWQKVKRYSKLILQIDPENEEAKKSLKEAEENS